MHRCMPACTTTAQCMLAAAQLHAPSRFAHHAQHCCKRCDVQGLSDFLTVHHHAVASHEQAANARSHRVIPASKPGPAAAYCCYYRSCSFPVAVLLSPNNHRARQAASRQPAACWGKPRASCQRPSCCCWCMGCCESLRQLKAAGTAQAACGGEERHACGRRQEGKKEGSRRTGGEQWWFLPGQQPNRARKRRYKQARGTSLPQRPRI